MVTAFLVAARTNFLVTAGQNGDGALFSWPERYTLSRMVVRQYRRQRGACRPHENFLDKRQNPDFVN
jgi:hypothetical protein